MKENICKWYDWQGLNFQNIQRACTTQQQKQKTQFKTEQKTYIDISPNKKYRWPIGTWKDAQQWKSKLQWAITSKQSEWPSSKSLQIINAGEGVKKKEPSYTDGGNGNWCSHFANSMGVPQNPDKTIIRKIHTPQCSYYDSSIHNSQDMETT